MPVQNEHNFSGTIIIGYQGIGKSSTINKYDFMGNKINSFIDLESSSFRLPDGSRHDDWYKYYINIALDLASQGNNVFISSHNTVREELASRIKSFPKIVPLIIYPDPSLKEQWIARLEQRYKENPTKKNELAFLNAKDKYLENINELKTYSIQNKFKSFVIESTEYNLYFDYLLGILMDLFEEEEESKT